ncbi:hypothetical protein BJ912DRAFT_946102 [Pholiota molesta]|nr:hypothetical protein BJ912DRAFT_946102 [Pholiota molesta]
MTLANMPSKGEQIPNGQLESPPPSRFLRCIIFLSFLWIILICIVMFAQWDVLNHIERQLFDLIMLFINTVTVIMLPILLLQPFRPWLDGARVFFLIMMHFGVALFFALKTPSFGCFSSTQNLGQEALCTTIIVFVNVFSWAIPLLVFIYGCGLALFVHRHSKLQTAPIVQVDVEKQLSQIEKQLPKPPKTHNNLQSHRSLDSSHEARMFAYAI